MDLTDSVLGAHFHVLTPAFIQIVILVALVQIFEKANTLIVVGLFSSYASALFEI